MAYYPGDSQEESLWLQAGIITFVFLLVAGPIVGYFSPDVENKEGE